MQALANPEKHSPLVQIVQVQVWDLVLLEPCLAPHLEPSTASRCSSFRVCHSWSDFSAFRLSWVRFVSQPDVLYARLESPSAAPLDLITCHHCFAVAVV